VRGLKGYAEGKRPVGRPRGGRLKAVGRDGTRILKFGNRRSAEDRDGWRRMIEETKARVGL
jgi:hypothetical protein